MVVPIERDKLVHNLESTGRVFVVGVYGMGKSLILDWVESEAKRVGDIVIRVSFKGLPKPSKADIPGILGYDSYLLWHAAWREKLTEAKNRGQKLYIIVDEVDQTIDDGHRFWEVLLNLTYYHAETIRLVVSSTPKILGMKKVAISRLMKGSVQYARALKYDEIQEVVKDHEKLLDYSLIRYLSSIRTISVGHYGTVKYLCQLIVENKYSGKKLSLTRVISWIRSRSDLDYFLDYTWEGLSVLQQLVVRRWIASRGKTVKPKDPGVRELVDAGLFYLGGCEVKWRIGYAPIFVREYVESIGHSGYKPDEIEMRMFGQKERLALELLIKNIGRVVTYDELGEVVYVKNQDEYSLWALSRMINRLRKKLMDIDRAESLTTVRGVGYLWG